MTWGRLGDDARTRRGRALAPHTAPRHGDRHEARGAGEQRSGGVRGVHEASVS
jgi:hypothetical protein